MCMLFFSVFSNEFTRVLLNNGFGIATGSYEMIHSEKCKIKLPCHFLGKSMRAIFEVNLRNERLMVTLNGISDGSFQCRRVGGWTDFLVKKPIPAKLLGGLSKSNNLNLRTLPIVLPQYHRRTRVLDIISLIETYGEDKMLSGTSIPRKGPVAQKNAGNKISSGYTSTEHESTKIGFH